MMRLAITMGEPGGIGPEVALKAIVALKGAFDPVLIGLPDVIEEARRLCCVALDIPVVKVNAPSDYLKCKPSATGGAAAAQSIKMAVGMAMRKEVEGIVTAPISKEALKMAGLPWPGHTEMLADLTDTLDYGMMLMGGGLRVMLLSIHRALRDVPGLVTEDAVLSSIRMARRACAMLGLDAPRIAVAALNPHAGEGGMFGDEEIKIISPAIVAARAGGINASGPYPPDTVFFRAVRGEFDIVVCMYHDQGLIPLKLLAFDTGVNVTVGLPIIRTSPDHGTAYDIAWQNKANPSSMIEAIRAALDMRL